ncbi:MAG: putative anti-sigma factor antagonist [Lentisphaerae bacterium ADurb.Bin242]|nr:MAG: putative anti-sigma factor antagonist [Lentisphaerae bacterium ADurb.Bin242]
MEITEKENGNILVVSIAGRLTADCADQFKRHMNSALAAHDKIVLNLGGMEYVDSTGLGAMVFILQKLSDEGGRLVLACLQPKPRIVFNITKAYKIFEIFDSVDAAIGAING